MKKTTKFLIIIFSILVFLCSLISNTHCSSDFNVETSSIGNAKNYYNMYNINNIKYVKYTHFTLKFNKYTLFFYSTNVESLPEEYVIGYTWTETQLISFFNGELIPLDLTLFIANRDDNGFSVILKDYNFNGYEDYMYNYTLDLIDIGDRHIQHLPLYSIELSKILDFTGYHLYNFWSLSYDIDFGDQFYYNENFAIVGAPYLSHNAYISDTSDFYRYVVLTVGDFKIESRILNTPTNNFERYYCTYLNSNLLQSNCVSSVEMFLYETNYFVFFGNDYLGGLKCGFYVATGNTYKDDIVMNIFSYSSSSNYSNSSTIPNGSSSYYKTAEWYDIGAHLYNFFVYLIFDAPIISNFTKLVMIVINFIVETFNFIIGLFSGIENAFFISVFVGMFALIFLLKIIFGGKT